MRKLILLLVSGFALSFSLLAQVRIQGRITDQSGEALPGVNVVEDGTNNFAVSDVNGNYVLTDVNRNSTLIFSFVGMLREEIQVGNRTRIDVVMREDAVSLEEVVAIGYGTVKKRDLTGAVQSIKSAEITQIPTGNMMQALQGRVAGLDIVRRSGRATSGVEMVLRGKRSISGSNTPLFIIDGVIGNYEDINPNDVESIEIMKDASSTAIYGSAGANGVIIVTTKKGQKGKAVVNVDSYYGVNGFLQFPPVRTGEDYIELRRQANLTTGAWARGDADSKLFSDPEWDAIQKNQWVDWFELGTRDGVLQNHSVSVSGGSENTIGYFSLNYYNEEGILKSDDISKYSFRANVEHQAKKWLKAGLNINGAFTDQNERKGQYFTRVLCLLPLGTPYNEDGTINPFPLAGDTQLSPIADMAEDQYVNNRIALGVNPTSYLQINPIKGLTAKSVFSAYLNFSRQGLFKGALSADGYGEGKSSAQIINGNRYNYKWENIVTYDFSIDDVHNFGITGVTSWSENQGENASILGYNLNWNKYLFYNLAATDMQSRVATSSYVRTQMMSYAARVNYNYMGRYFLTVSNRWDGASILAEGNKWDYFPAAALAWRISDEGFMQGLDKLDNLKLRLGYGVTGNAGASAYATLNFGVAGSNLAFQETPAPYYMFSQNLANQVLDWEKSYNWNLGIDLNMFKNRVNITTELYNTDTKDILFKRNLPASTGGYKAGNYSIWENVCETQNRGIEFEVNTVNIKSNNFSWSTTLSLAANREKITKFVSEDPVTNGSTYLVEGYPIQSFYDYKYLGIWQEDEATEAALYGRVPGDVKIEEVLVDSTYTTADRQVIGSPTPKLIFGLSNTFTYKGIDLTVLLDARIGQTMSYGILGWYNPNGEGNGPAVVDYWTPENPEGRFPRPNASYSRFANLPLGTNSLFYIDGSYCKVRNVTLGYSLPNNLLRKLNLNKARIYATASNPVIFTKSKYLKNYDPELGGADEFPLAKQLVFGINLSF